MAFTNVDPSYNWQLKQSIQATFVSYVKPMSVLPYFAKYYLIFNEADSAKIRAVTRADGDYDGAVELLERLCCYADWFQCLTTVLRDPDVKLTHAAELIEKVKIELDIRLGVKNPDEEVRNHKEETCQKKHQLSDLTAGKNQATQKTRQILGTQNGNEKLTAAEKVDATLRESVQSAQTVCTNLENLDHSIQEERRHHEEVVKQLKEETRQKEEECEKHKDKIQQLEAERENLEKIIQQERRHQKEETRQKDQLITNLRNSIQSLQVQRTTDATKTQVEISDLLSTKKTYSDGVLVWNYWVKYCMTKQYPDIAQKWGLTEVNLPSHLKAAWWFVCRRGLCENNYEQVKKHGLTKAKHLIKTSLREILKNVNMKRKENENDVIITYELQCDMRYFFGSCYSCIIGLDTHGINSVKECLMYIKDSITENLDQLLEEFGGWNDVMSEDTWDRYDEAKRNAERVGTL